MLIAYLVGAMLAAGMGVCSAGKWADENPGYKVTGFCRIPFMLIAGILCASLSWFSVGILLVDEIDKSGH